jgi:hypothetical protein
MSDSNLIAYMDGDQQDGAQRDYRKESACLSMPKQTNYGCGEEQEQRQRELDSESHQEEVPPSS